MKIFQMPQIVFVVILAGAMGNLKAMNAGSAEIFTVTFGIRRLLIKSFSGSLREQMERDSIRALAPYIKDAASIHERCSQNRTLLHLAAELGCVEVTKWLIEQGASTNVKDRVDNTPLHEAAGKVRPSYANTVQALIEGGADVNAKGSSGLTPLHKAVDRGNKKSVEVLLRAGADVNAKCNQGRTPLDVAYSWEACRQDEIDLLEKAGALRGKNLR